jgi:adenylyltransferase/sulfurtransferase
MQKNFLQRYERHIDVPEIGVEGQKKLAAARVLIVGMGGLGCPAALYLAAAGIGTIGLADADTVSLSNLQRQVLYDEADIGTAKTAAAAAALRRKASACDIRTYPFFLTPENAGEIIAQHDIVLDCTDNFDTRYLLNACCHAAKKPLVSASVYHHDGQISVFRAFDGGALPCYQCLYPKSDQLTLAPQCKEGGILGPVTGILGTLQAVATINEILGIGESLAGWLLSFSSLDFAAQKIRLSRRDDCNICSNNTMEINTPVLPVNSGCGLD